MFPHFKLPKQSPKDVLKKCINMIKNFTQVILFEDAAFDSMDCIHYCMNSKKPIYVIFSVGKNIEPNTFNALRYHTNKLHYQEAVNNLSLHLYL